MTVLPLPYYLAAAFHLGLAPPPAKKGQTDQVTPSTKRGLFRGRRVLASQENAWPDQELFVRNLPLGRASLEAMGGT